MAESLPKESSSCVAAWRCRFFDRALPRAVSNDLVGEEQRPFVMLVGGDGQSNRVGRVEKNFSQRHCRGLRKGTRLCA